MSVKSLIEASAAEVAPFTDAMLSDIREVLYANDAQPNRLKRVSLEKMLGYLKEKHGYALGRQGFERHVKAALGRSWSGA